MPSSTVSPKVSVYMTTFNHERYIAQAIDSVLAQEAEFGWELVIGEDCSTDGTQRVARSYELRFPGAIRVITSDANVGMRRNMQRTVAACRGAYVAKLEGDDYWTDSRKLQKQAAFMEAHPDVALCYTNAVEFDDASPEVRKVMIGPGERKPLIDLSELVKANQLISPTIMYRRFDPLRLPALYFKAPYGDWPLNCLLARTGSVAYMEDVTAAYRRHSGGVFTRHSDTEKIYNAAQTQALIDRMLDYEYHKIIVPELRRKYVKVMRYGIGSREWSYVLRAGLALLCASLANGVSRVCKNS